MGNKSILVAIIVCILVSASIAPADTVGHWSFNEGAGTNVDDSSHEENHGSISSDRMWASPGWDGSGYCLQFQGYSGTDYAVVPHDEYLNFNGYLSISARVKPLDNGQSILPVVNKGFSSTSYCLDIYDQQIRFWANYQTGGVEIDVRTDETIPFNEWSHIAAIYNGNSVKLYINGELKKEQSVSIPIVNNSGALYIGIDYPGFDEKYKGMIDEVIIVPEPALQVTVDIKPQSCPNPLNIKSKGVLPVAILGTEDFDVNDINVPTITLEGVLPIRNNYEDVATPLVEPNECECSTEGLDGYPDLTLKFDTQAILEALGEVADAEEWVLVLDGLLYDGTPIEGEDCIIIRAKSNSKNR